MGLALVIIIAISVGLFLGYLYEEDHTISAWLLLILVGGVYFWGGVFWTIAQDYGGGWFVKYILLPLVILIISFAVLKEYGNVIYDHIGLAPALAFGSIGGWLFVRYCEGLTSKLFLKIGTGLNNDYLIRLSTGLTKGKMILILLAIVGLILFVVVVVTAIRATIAKLNRKKLLKYLNSNMLKKGYIKNSSSAVPPIYYGKRYPQGMSCESIVKGYIQKIEEKYILKDVLFGETLKKCIMKNTAADIVQLTNEIKDLDCLRYSHISSEYELVISKMDELVKGEKCGDGKQLFEKIKLDNGYLYKLKNTALANPDTFESEEISFEDL